MQPSFISTLIRCRSKLQIWTIVMVGVSATVCLGLDCKEVDHDVFRGQAKYFDANANSGYKGGFLWISKKQTRQIALEICKCFQIGSVPLNVNRQTILDSLTWTFKDTLAHSGDPATTFWTLGSSSQGGELTGSKLIYSGVYSKYGRVDFSTGRFTVNGIKSAFDTDLRNVLCTFDQAKPFSNIYTILKASLTIEIRFKTLLGPVEYKVQVKETSSNKLVFVLELDDPGAWVKTPGLNSVPVSNLYGGVEYTANVQANGPDGNIFGWFTPKDFLLDCSGAMWDIGCTRPCGHCLHKQCSIYDGYCTPCTPFWISSTCTEHIADRNLTSNALQVTVESVTATVTFYQVRVTDELAFYYSHVVSYQSLSTNITKTITVDYHVREITASVQLEDLEPVSVYRVRVTPFRKDILHKIQEAAGSPSDEVIFNTDCQDGFWSANCTKPCANCSSGRCVWETGSCKPADCHPWFIPPLCSTPIVTPDLSHHQLKLEWRTFEAASISFPQLALEDFEAPYYYYVVDYSYAGGERQDTYNDTASESALGNKVKSSSRVDHDADADTLHVVLKGLVPNTYYTVTVRPFRRDRNLSDDGLATEALIFITDCAPGWHGSLCDLRCGQCNNTVCERFTGHCPCAVWWVPPVCKEFIARPDGTSLAVTTLNVTTTGFNLQFHQLDINESVAQFYHYDVQYKEPGEEFILGKQVKHRFGEGTVNVILDGLGGGKDYILRIVPVREIEMSPLLVADAGAPASDVLATTSCSPGSYGDGCLGECHCRIGPCDTKSGVCATAGCEDWWTLSSCSLLIREPTMEARKVTALALSPTSARLEFESLEDIPETIAAQYGYFVLYRRQSDTQSNTQSDPDRDSEKPDPETDLSEYTSLSAIPHDSGLEVVEVTLEGLQPATTYLLRVAPFRVDPGNELRANGTSSVGVYVDTLALTDSGVARRVGLAAAGGSVAGVVILGSAIAAMLYHLKRRKKPHRINVKPAED